ncbi:MAG: hypothetical protein ACOY46_20615 [Bacillota bacterium]
MSQENSKSWFVRILIILYIIFLLTLVSTSFWKKHPPFEISTTIITLLLLVTLLILSEAFDNLSLGKMLSLSREVKHKKEEVASVKKENAELRENIIKISTMISQRQNNMTINGVTPELLQLLGVTKANNATLDEDFDEELEEKQLKASKPAEDEQKESSIPKYLLMPYAEKESIKKYLDRFQIPESDVIWEAQFTPAFQGLDQIMERKIVFNAYLKTPLKETFIEVKFISSLSPMIFDRLYVLLSKILFYKQAKNIKAELVLLLVDIQTQNNKEFDFRFRRFIEAFQPAIANDLLRVETISFSEEDLIRWTDEVKKGQYRR